MADLADQVYWRLLVVRCQLGDQQAFAELVAACQPRLRAYLNKMLGRPSAVDDLAQEVWMDVFRDLPRLIEPGAFFPWFYRIAHNRAFRLLRRRAEPVLLAEDVPAADETIEFTAEDAKAVHDALDQLPPQQREALLLKFMENMSYEQIAAVADCPVGTIRSRIHNGKRQLKMILERETAHDTR